MKIHVARRAGFCMGVRRALDLALDLAHRERRPVYTFGPLIHNPQVVALLERKGVRKVDSEGELAALPAGVVLIRAHGVAPATLARIRDLGHEVVNATCPKVQYVQGKIQRHARDGRFTVIVGDEGHPEVVGLQGFAGCRHAVVRDVAEAAARVPAGEARLCVVAQTTQDAETFAAVADFLKGRHPDVVVAETICDSTHRRQSEVRELSAGNDAVVIVGGRSSGNTKRLAELAERDGARAIAVETAADLDPALLDGCERVGLTAGASTPNWLIREARERLEAIRLARMPLLPRVALLALRLLVVTGVHTALCAAALCAGTLAAGGARSIPPGPLAVPFLYVFGLFLLARLADLEAFAHNDPGRAATLAARAPLFKGLALAALAAALLGAWNLFPGSAFALAFAALPIAAAPLSGGRLARLPAAKPLFAALIGPIAIYVAPLCGSDAFFRDRPHALVPDPTGTTVFGLDGIDLSLLAFLAGLFFFRQLFLDWRDVQGDRVAGSRTLPVVRGVARTREALSLASAVCLIASLALWAFGAPPARALPFLLSAAALPLLLLRAERVHALRDPELPLDLALLLPGLAALLP